MKPLYIEVEEEVTSVIDRLRASQQSRVVFVVPPGATLLQSAVNMRLLLREAQKAGKDIALVTTDEYGQTLAQKVGISVYASPNDVEGLETDAEAVPSQPSQHTIGTTSYFEHSTPAPHSAPHSAPQDSSQAVPQTPPTSVPHSGGNNLGAPNVSVDGIAQEYSSGGRVASPQVPPVQPSVEMSAASSAAIPTGSSSEPHRYAASPTPATQTSVAPTPAAPSSSPDMSNASLDHHKQRELQDFFRRDTGGGGAAPHITSYAHVPEDMNASPPRRTWVIVGALVATVIAALCVIFLIFFPQVQVTLIPTVREESASFTVNADATVGTTDFSQRRMGLVAIEKEVEKTKEFSATGTSSQGSYKARGTVTIYNTYSSAPQKLVATTRLLTDDGILFRLVDSVVVPGVKIVDGKRIPGTIEATVIADKPGEQYNIGPSTFSIPGFKGSPRYGKFYAKSATPMTGGSTEGGTKTVVTKEDIERAKKETEAAARTAVIEAITEAANTQNMETLEEMIDVEVVSSGTQVVDGVAAEAFDYTVTVRATALTFSKNDMRIMAVKALEKRVGDESVSPENITIHYSPALVDFQKRSAQITARATARLVATPDTKAIASALVGRKMDDLQEVLTSFDGVESAKINTGINLFGRMPYYSGSIHVTVESSQ